jgi:hypothetical protein
MKIRDIVSEAGIVQAVGKGVGGLAKGVGTVTGIRVTRTGTGSYDAGNVTVSYR